MAAPYPNPNVTGYVELLQYTNTVTNNLFGLGLLLMIFIVSFLSLKIYTTERAFATASFITAMSSYFLAILGLIATIIVVVPTIMALISIIILIKE